MTERGDGDWSPGAYLAFANERARPALDLLGRVALEAPRRVVDAGCGPGNSTALLRARWPSAEVQGFDASPAMVAAARAALPDCRFEVADVGGFIPEDEVDLVYANALFQWVPNPLGGLARILNALRPGAVLAAQMPDNVGEPTHRLMAESAAAGPWAARLAGAARPPLPPPSAFHRALSPLGEVDLWRTTYFHPLAGVEAVVELVRSTGLRPYLAPLDAEETEAFLADYRKRLRAVFPADGAGRVLLPFPRLFLVASRR